MLSRTLCSRPRPRTVIETNTKDLQEKQDRGLDPKSSVVTVIEAGTETAVFIFAKPNRTETAVLCLCIDGSVLKWSSSGFLS